MSTTSKLSLPQYLEGAPAAVDRRRLAPQAREHARGDHAVHGIVVDDQNAQGQIASARPRRVAVVQGGAALLRGRQATLECEGATAPQLALHANPRAHQGRDALADGQAQPRAAETPGGGAVGLRERIEDRLDGFCADAHARVPDPKAQQLGFARNRFCGQLHVPLERELDGVVEQVQEHLPQAYGIADDAAGNLRRDRQAQIEVLAPGGVQLEVDDRAHHLVQVEVDPLELQAIALDFGVVEHVVDDPQQPAGRAVDDVDQLALFAAEVPLPQELCRAQDAVHGRAQLVADRGHEAPLGLAGLLGAGLGLQQLRRQALQVENRSLQLAVGAQHRLPAAQRQRLGSLALELHLTRAPTGGTQLLLEFLDPGEEPLAIFGLDGHFPRITVTHVSL